MKSINKFFYNFRLEHLWAIAVLLSIFIYVNSLPIMPYDFWLHIATGQEIVSTSTIPTVDSFSYTRAGVSFTSASAYWLMQIVMYLIYKSGGGELIVTIQSIVITLCYSILLITSFRVSQNLRASAVAVIFAALLGYGNWNVRPQTIAYLLGAITLFTVYEHKSHKTNHWLIILPVAITIWINSHPSFPLGLIIISCWFLDYSVEIFNSKEWNKLIIPSASIIVSFDTCLISPYGIDVGTYVFSLISQSDISNYIIEWRPPTFETLYGSIFLISLILSTTLLIFNFKKFSLMDLLIFLVFGFLGLKYIRGAVWFGIVITPLISKLLANFMFTKPTPYKKFTDYTNRIFLLFFISIAILSLPYFKKITPFSVEKSTVYSVETPIVATQFILDNHLPGNIFHSADFSSYLMWAGHPEYPVFIDLRFDTELYPLSLWDEYASISEARDGWEEKITKYNINTLILSPTSEKLLILAVENSKNWKVVYQDSISVVFTKEIFP